MAGSNSCIRHSGTARVHVNQTGVGQLRVIASFPVSRHVHFSWYSSLTDTDSRSGVFHGLACRPVLSWLCISQRRRTPARIIEGVDGAAITSFAYVGQMRGRRWQPSGLQPQGP